MPHQIRHEEIVKQFLDTKAVDFNALGKFVAEFGSSIAASGRGDYGVRIGHYNILACFNIGPVVASPFDVNVASLKADVVGV
jgi:hypothetical protein